VADLHVKVEPAFFDELKGRADRGPRPRQHDAEDAPAPHDQVHATVVDDKCETEPERSETFAQETLETAASFLLRTHEAAIGKLPPPRFNAVARHKGDLDLDMVAGIGKSKQVRDQSRERPGAAVDACHTFGLKLTLEFMHNAPRRGHAVECVAEQAAIERRGRRQTDSRAGVDATAREHLLVVG
jgi:hypothetical protein